MVKVSRRAFLAGCGGAASCAVGAAYYGSMVEPFWLDLHDNTVILPAAFKALHGIRIAHVTDMHLQDRDSVAFSAEVARRVREEVKPDLVAFTGDLTTHSPKHLDAGIEWLRSFGSPTFVCLGNHDYDPFTSARTTGLTSMADDTQRRLEGSGVTLLRNANTAIDLKGGRLHIAGVEDWYTGLTDPIAATRGIPEGAPRLMLCHNPDAAELVDPATDSGLILSGHTHGGQICLPLVGPLMLPLMDRAKAAGQFKLPKGSTLYVSRGIGYLLRARMWCRPEVVVHRVVSA